jgi:hypothetical protein
VEWLRIELAREGLDLFRIHDVSGAGEALADMEILEIEAAIAVAVIGFGHTSPALMSLAS